MWFNSAALPKDPKLGSGLPQITPKTTIPTPDVQPGEVRQKRIELDVSQLPEKVDLSGTESGIGPLVAAGLARLGDDRYKPDTEGTLNFMVKTMQAGASGPAAKAVEDAVAQVRSGFSQLLRGMVSVTPETLKSIKQDVPKLVDLAVVALGSGKADSNQLVADLDVVRQGLSDLIAMTPDARSARIDKIKDDFGWAASVFSRGESALQAADLNVTNRLQAISGIFAIISKYAGGAEAAS